MCIFIIYFPFDSCFLCGAGAAALGQQLTAARAAVEAARRDNVALVERLKFVQSYPPGGRRDAGDPVLPPEQPRC